MITLTGYKIEQELYAGLKSIVYRAKKEDKFVIIKVLYNEYPDPIELSAFRQEYAIVKNLNSSLVVRVVGLEKYKNSIAIIFEDIAGEALSKILEDKRILPLNEILDLMLKSTKAIGELHKMGLVHKDIKPHNIVLNQKTGDLQIIDFGNASLLTKQNSYTPLNSSIEGTLAYISPEQTGRMNRTIDYRTDYYSLGVTFYQLLTGKLPFFSNDPMELVHAHIAKIPTPPKDSGLAQPTAQQVADLLSDIIMKLLQKNPEDRYQSIAGLVYDLEWCLKSLETGRDQSLQIGAHDFSSKFQIPEKLYGRTKEINQIVETFKDVATGNTELILISGRSGIGKSALINEVNKPITEYKGYFASGKYDYFKRAIPFHAIGQAFQSLIQQILTGSQSEIDIWKKNLLSAVGQNGQVIVDLIPELENLIGKQPVVPELGSSESQNRFNLVFQNFIQAFCTMEHPIAIFLDDLQWADNPSISLIQTIISNPEMKYLYLMLSFRDNEVLPTDSFSMMLESLKKAGFTYKEILLEPISISDISQLIGDTLRIEKTKAKELATVLFEKTKGNPFFVNELFTSFYKDELVYLDNGLYKDSELYKDSGLQPTVLWNWDISKIQEAKISENVIDLMVEKVQELTPNQIELLKLAACVGDSFELDLFFKLADQEIDMVTQELTTISNEGFLLLTKNQVRFVHDKVREATYSLVSEEERTKNHYQIGSTYLRNAKEDEIEDIVFTIVNQLNQGVIHVTSSEEKARLQELNIIAGNKSLASTAYEAALNFFQMAINPLSENSWETNYDLTLELYTKRGRVEYLSKDYVTADKTFDLILSKTKNILDNIPVYELKLSMYTAQNKFIDALIILKQAIKDLGMNLPKKPTEASPLPEIIKFKLKQGKKPIQDLTNLPFMTKENSKAIMQLMNAGIAPSFISEPNLFPVLVLKMVNLSLREGNFYLSPFAYVAFGLIQGSGLGDFNSGYEFGKLALDLIPKLGDKAKQIECRTYFLFAAMVSHWKCHAKEVLPYFQKAIQSGQENGDLQYTSYAINNMNIQAYLMRENLDTLSEKFSKFLPTMNMLQQRDATLYYAENCQFIENLRGNAKDIFQIDGENFDEKITVAEWKNANNANVLFTYYTSVSEIHYLFGDSQRAFEYSLLATPYEGGAFGMMQIPEHVFFDSLICAKLLLKTTDKKKQKEYRKRLDKNYKRMKKWGENCEANYGHKCHIIEGLIEQIENKTDKALASFEIAINLAKQYEYTLEEALANEFMAEIWTERGKERYAEMHLMEAHYAYKRWGCEPKVKQLEEKYPGLKRHATSGISSDASFGAAMTISTSSTASKTTAAGSNFLDLNTVVKASQTISGEIQLGKLLEKMMKILFENAGAERGFFILKEKENWVIEAEGNANTETISVLQTKPVESNPDLSPNIVNYVVRTKGIVLLNDAMKIGMFTNDSYIVKRQPKSILCYPVINQGNLVGVVYLENNLTTDAFTPDRVEVLKILSSQIAVSVENSLLYANLEQKVIERTTQVNEMLDQVGKLYVDSESKRKEIEVLAESRKRLSLVGQMAAGIVHDIKNPMATIKAMAELANSDKISPQKRERNLKMIMKEMDRLSDLAYEILDFSKGELKLDLKEINLKEFISEIGQFLEMNFKYANIQYIEDLQYEGNISIDKDRMRRVIVNLSKNAIEAMYDGKREYTFTIRTQKSPLSPFAKGVSAKDTFLNDSKDSVKGGFLISLIDNGSGIPESVQERIFQAFSTEGKAKGTGLGLFMSKWIVEAHNGKLTYETKQGEGTTFFIELPAGQ